MPGSFMLCLSTIKMVPALSFKLLPSTCNTMLVSNWLATPRQKPTAVCLWTGLTLWIDSILFISFLFISNFRFLTSYENMAWITQLAQFSELVVNYQLFSKRIAQQCWGTLLKNIVALFTKESCWSHVGCTICQVGSLLRASATKDL